MSVEQLRDICEVGRKKKISGEVLNIICESAGGDYTSILYILNNF